MTVEVQSDVAVAAQLFRGSGDPTRLAILTELLAGERRVVDLVEAVGCSQSNVSGHLACLKECGLVIGPPAGPGGALPAGHTAVVDLLRQAETLLGEVGQQVALCAQLPHGRPAMTTDVRGRADPGRDPVGGRGAAAGAVAVTGGALVGVQRAADRGRLPRRPARRTAVVVSTVAVRRRRGGRGPVLRRRGDRGAGRPSARSASSC